MQLSSRCDAIIYHHNDCALNIAICCVRTACFTASCCANHVLRTADTENTVKVLDSDNLAPDQHIIECGYFICEADEDNGEMYLKSDFHRQGDERANKTSTDRGTYYASRSSIAKCRTCWCFRTELLYLWPLGGTVTVACHRLDQRRQMTCRMKPKLVLTTVTNSYSSL